MNVKGGVLYLDFTSIDVTGAGETLAGTYESIYRAKGKPIYVYAAVGTVYGEGFGTVIFRPSDDVVDIALTVYDTETSVLLNVLYTIDNEDAVVPTVTAYTPVEE